MLTGTRLSIMKVRRNGMEGRGRKESELAAVVIFESRSTREELELVASFFFLT